MSRRRSPAKRQILPDPIYKDVVVSKFINCVMEAGKKTTAEGILYGALEDVERKTKVDPLEAFRGALQNVRPSVEVRSRRIGGATYPVPIEVRDSRSMALAIRWLIAAALKRAEKTMRARLSGELIDAFNNKGAAVKKREETHKMAEANRAFAHYKV
jgi:small subunit ribosomal protein S7